MDTLTNNASIFTTIILYTAIVFCFYYTLCFFEHLIKGNESFMKKAKRGAVICLIVVLAIPAINTIYYMFLMNQYIE